MPTITSFYQCFPFSQCTKNPPHFHFQDEFLVSSRFPFDISPSSLLKKNEISPTGKGCKSSPPAYCILQQRSAFSVCLTASSLSLSLCLAAFAHSKCRQFQHDTAVSRVTPHTINIAVFAFYIRHFFTKGIKKDIFLG